MRSLIAFVWCLTLTACGNSAVPSGQTADARPFEDGATGTDWGIDAGDAAMRGDGPPPTPIPDDSGDLRKLVFVTTALFSADLGGLAGADAKCQSAAVAAQLSGTFKAWLGDMATNAEDRLTHASVPYQLVDSTLIANDWAELLTPDDAMLAHPIDETELGKPATAQPVTSDCQPTAWTGAYVNSPTNTFGECGGWTSAQDVDGGSGGASLGATNRTNAHWQYVCYTFQCSQLAPLYCFEQ